MPGLATLAAVLLVGASGRAAAAPAVATGGSSLTLAMTGDQGGPEGVAPPPARPEDGAMPAAEATTAPAAPLPPRPEAAPEDPTPVQPVIPKKRIIRKHEDLSHKYQFGISAAPGVGFRVIFPYDSTEDDPVDCGDRSGDSSKRVCTNSLPVYVELGGSFGVTDNLDVITDFRFGLKSDFSNHKQVAVAPGIRYWVGPHESVKFFATAQISWDHTPQDQEGIDTNDFALRNANGLMIDMLKNFGLFFQFGETIGFKRWLRFELDASGGLQLRFP